MVLGRRSRKEAPLLNLAFGGGGGRIKVQLLLGSTSLFPAATDVYSGHQGGKDKEGSTSFGV